MGSARLLSCYVDTGRWWAGSDVSFRRLVSVWKRRQNRAEHQHWLDRKCPFDPGITVLVRFNVVSFRIAYGPDIFISSRILKQLLAATLLLACIDLLLYKPP